MGTAKWETAKWPVASTGDGSRRTCRNAKYWVLTTYMEAYFYSSRATFLTQRRGVYENSIRRSIYWRPTTDRPTNDLTFGKIQMAISPRGVVQSTSCLVQRWGFSNESNRMGSNAAISGFAKSKMAARTQSWKIQMAISPLWIIRMTLIPVWPNSRGMWEKTMRNE